MANSEIQIINKKNITSRNYFYDFLKGLGCIGVICIHVKFPGMMGTVLSRLASFAVPVFFMIAGYYAYKCTLETIKRRLKKIVEYFIFGYSCFVAYNSFLAIRGGYFVWWLKDNYNIKALLKGILFCDIDFAIPLWYLIAMSEIYLLWYIVVKKGKELLVAKGFSILFILYIVSTIIVETKEYDWFWQTNFVTRGLSWFTFGYYTHSIEEEKLVKKNNQVFIFMALLGGVIAVLPELFNTAVRFSCVGTVLFSCGLFILATKNSKMIISKSVGYIGNKLSFNIYIFHSLIAGILSQIVKWDSKLLHWIFPVITAILSIFFSQIIECFRCSIGVKIKSLKRMIF